MKMTAPWPKARPRAWSRLSRQKWQDSRLPPSSAPMPGDLIAMWTLAITQGLKVSAIAGMVLPYPTLGEAGKRAAITYYAGLAAKPLIESSSDF